MRQIWALTIYDGKDAHGVRVAIHTSRGFSNQAEAAAYRLRNIEWQSAVIELMPEF